MKLLCARISLLLCASTPALSKDRPPLPEPSVSPDWAAVRTRAETGMKAELYDPNSALFVWTSGFEWGYIKELFGKRNWGWVACLDLNAKNRFGGYIGAEPRWYINTADGQQAWGSRISRISQCDTPNKVKLQPQLAALTTTEPVPAADQLAKLATLLEKGLITRAEFDAEKNRLLGRK